MSIQAIKKTVHVTSDTTEKLVSDISLGVLETLKGVTGGVGNVIINISDIISKLGKNISIASKTVSYGVGNVSKEVANDLGNVIKRIPLIGGASAYIVKGSGKGVYFIVMTVADIIDKMTKIVGKTAKTSCNVIVFTLVQAEDLTEDVILKSNKVVSNVLSGLKKMTNKSKKKLTKAKKSKRK
jgi:hypothetical protein